MELAMLDVFEVIFDEVDKNKDGQLSMPELLRVFVKGRGLNSNDARALFKGIDSDGDYKVSREEWIAYAEKLSVEDRKAVALSDLCLKWDKKDDQGNRDGKLSKDELRDILKKLNKNEEPSPEDVDKYFKLADADGDGKIDYKELISKLFETHMK